MNRRSSIH